MEEVLPVSEIRCTEREKYGGGCVTCAFPWGGGSEAVGAFLLLEHQRKHCLAQVFSSLQDPVLAAWYSLLWQRRKDRRSGVIATDLSTGLMQRILFQSHLVPFSSVLH